MLRRSIGSGRFAAGDATKIRAVAGQAPQVSQDEALVAASQAAVDKPRHDFSDGVIAGSVAFAAGTTGDDKLDFERTGKEAANLLDILDS